VGIKNTYGHYNYEKNGDRFFAPQQMIYLLMDIVFAVS
jgi:hypothetical protein